MASLFFTQNKANSRRSRTEHRRAGHAGSWHRQARPTQDQAAQTCAKWDGRTRRLDNACPPGAVKHILSMLWWPDEGWQMADRECQGADGGCQADNECEVSSGGCVGGKNSEPMAQEYPDVPVEEDQEPKKAPNKANLESTQVCESQEIESELTKLAGRKQSQMASGERIMASGREQWPGASESFLVALAVRHTAPPTASATPKSWWSFCQPQSENETTLGCR